MDDGIRQLNERLDTLAQQENVVHQQIIDSIAEKTERRGFHLKHEVSIGDLYTMGPREAALAAKILGARKVVPLHFGTFPPLTGRPETLVELLGDDEGVDVWTLEPGKTVQW